jgi:hypothetical protein
MEGHVTQVSIKDGKIVQTFNSGRHSEALQPPLKTQAYIYHRGGVLRFGKLIMEDADLELVGDRGTPFFDFFLREYKSQLIPGYSKNTASNGLIVHMVDHSRVSAGRQPATGGLVP